MIEGVFRYIARVLAGLLEKFADPQLQSKLDAYNTKVAALEQKEKDAADAEKASEAAYQKSLASRQAWESLITESSSKEQELESQLKASQDRVKELQDAVDKAKLDIDHLSDHDAIRGDV